MNVPTSIVLLGVSFAGAAAAQGPTCLFPTTGPEEVQYLWGGEMRHLFALETDGEQHLWNVGDGGRILHAVLDETAASPGIAWEFQSTPFAARHNLLDVYFRHVGAKTIGWACGLGGTLLTTSDLGATWNVAPQILDQQSSTCGGPQPAALWRARFLDADLGFAAGLWTFKVNKGFSTFPSAWDDVELYDDATLTNQVDPSAFEFYAMDFLGDADAFIGIVAGQAWSGHCPASGAAGVGHVYTTDSRVPASLNGKRWWRVYSEDPSGTTTINDPWDFEFEPQSALDLDNWQGFLVGGTGVSSGTILRFQQTNSSGAPQLTVSHEAGGGVGNINTMYGVAALGNGQAIAAGYGGRLLRREANGSWTVTQDGTFSAPLGDVQGYRFSDGSVGALATGSFGFLRSTADYATSWEDTNPSSSQANLEHWRLRDVWFLDDVHGLALSAWRTVLRTADGGCNWDVVNGGILTTGNNAPLNAVSFDPTGTKGVAVGTPSGGQPWAFTYTTDLGVTWLPGIFGAPPQLPAQYTLNAVTHSGGNGFWAVGNEQPSSGTQPPLVFFSIPTGSQAPGEVWYQIDDCLESGVELTGVAFLHYGSGLIVGRKGAAGRAYRVYYSTSPPNCTGLPWHVEEITLPPGTPALNAIASRSSTGEALAVGDGGTVLSWNGSSFLSVTLPTGIATSRDLISIDMHAATGLTLIGTKGRFDQGSSHEAGQLLKRDGGVWSAIKSQTNDSVAAIHLIDSPRADPKTGGVLGWLVTTGVNASNSEFGSVADAGFHHFRSDEP